PDEAALVLMLGRQQSIGWLVTKTDLLTRALPPAAVLNAQATDLHDALSRQSRDYGVIAEQLGNTLLDWGGALANINQLEIVADGALHYLPPDALTINGISHLEGKAVAGLPSLNTLMLLRREPAAYPATIAVLADPVFNTDDSRVNADDVMMASPVQLATDRRRLNRLTMTAAEADAIKRTATNQEVTILSGFAANAAALKRPDVTGADILHIATHGFVDDEFTERTGLELSSLSADGNAITGFVSLRDIYNMTIEADLVVLSACETALGKRLAGEGLLGLTRGFLHAGANRVVATLWPVQDRATAELMGHFYRGLLQERLPPAAALANAKQALQRNRRWRHPYFWSGFVLLGDWQSST
ncbi:MAG: CHAT domain-containing protein, partial [Pseudomonadota bacterium]